jgi:signal transduction histidine kinase
MSRGPAEPFELLAHRAVVRDGRVVGELAMVGAMAGAGLWALPESRGLLLTFPLAVLVSAAAGLFMVRMLVRRLNALERVTDRLSGGDIAVPDGGTPLDEIGRLEARFNRMADKVEASRERLEENDRQRRRLLADISHELATPLTSIRGYVETLLDPGVSTTGEERTRYLQDVLEESKRLDAMIAELFDLARLEAGASPLKRDRLDWTELCRNTARRLEPRFREARIALTWAGHPEAAWVMADGRRLEEVAENLLSNALRYVPAGGAVQLSMTRFTTPAGERLRFAVEDDGPGIAAEDLPHVFERFYRAEAVRSMGGSGLGLAIVAEIVRLHGGEVGVRRRDPRGAAFTVDLPPDR